MAYVPATKLRLYAPCVAARDLSGRTLGDFLLVARIDTGGFGDVYRAVQLSIGRTCVVKVLLEERLHRSAKSQLRFRREAELAARIDHPYAAQIYGYGTEGEIQSDDLIVWIAMELVQGVTLGDWLRKNGPMPFEQFVPFFTCLAEVVQNAHDLGIVHRDIKPSNIMVIERAGRAFPKLIDLGIAKPMPEIQAQLAEGSLAERVPGLKRDRAPRTVPLRPHARPRTRTWSGPLPNDSVYGHRKWRMTTAGCRIGSWAYMSPEQWADSPDLGAAADLYALGVVAYELLTGHHPFVAEGPDEYASLHRHAPVPSIGSPELDPILVRALAKTPSGRQGSVMELAAEFGAALRAIERGHIRSAAQAWADRGRSSRLLWGAGMVADFERSRTQNARLLTELEYEFIEASQRHVRRAGWLRRAAGAMLVVGAVAAIQYRAHNNAQLADERASSARHVTEAVRTEGELEQGRSALLHGEPDALVHLAAAYRSEPLSSTAFMLSRAMQPRLAEQARFPATKGRMWSATFSPSGKQIITTDDGAAQVWDASTNHLLFTLVHGDIVYQAIYSTDGAWIVTACGDGSVRLWDARSGKLVHQLHREGTTPRYFVVAMSPDSKFVAAIGLGGTAAHVWDTASGALIAELRQDASDGPSLAFSADGRWLATGGENARVFDTKTWAEVRVIEEASIRGVSWDPSGARLLTGSSKGDASIWEIPSGRRLHHLRETGESVEAVAFSHDGKLAAAATYDGAELVWDATTGTLQSTTNPLRTKLLSIEFDSSSTLVVAASSGGSVAVTDTASGMPVSVLDGPLNVVRVAHFDPTAARVVGASWDGTARIWDATSPYRKWASPPASDDCGLIPSLEPDRRFLAVSCRDNPTRIWDTARDQLVAELPSVTPPGDGFEPAFPAVSESGDRAAIARGTTVEVYDLPSGHLLRKITHGAPVSTVAFAPSGRTIVSGARDGSLTVTRDKGATLMLPVASGGIDAAGFLPDGRIVATDERRRLRVFDESGEVLTDLEMAARTRTLRMSRNSQRLLTLPHFMGRAAAPELWDLERYRRVAQFDGQGQIYSGRFVGERVLTAGSDGAARLWDDVTGQLLQTYHGGSRFLVDVTLSTDGSMVIGGGGDGILRFWDTASARPLWKMPAHRSHLVGVRVDGNEVITRGFSGDISRWDLPDPQHVFEACGRHVGCAILPR